ncbi:hypothetical protein HU200_001945 [Digitaria exilis]|uniref:Uncharacterized protein n=1 Tax=Digitaria exilis TaxID=1010633 RepID=A0A835G0R1_9POAL|nr:hypothetical protein HU200_001945 [Digitaria exilis]
MLSQESHQLGGVDRMDLPNSPVNKRVRPSGPVGSASPAAIDSLLCFSSLPNDRRSSRSHAPRPLARATPRLAQPASALTASLACAPTPSWAPPTAFPFLSLPPSRRRTSILLPQTTNPPAAPSSGSKGREPRRSSAAVATESTAPPQMLSTTPSRSSPEKSRDADAGNNDVDYAGHAGTTTTTPSVTTNMPMPTTSKPGREADAQGAAMADAHKLFDDLLCTGDNHDTEDADAGHKQEQRMGAAHRGNDEADANAQPRTPRHHDATLLPRRSRSQGYDKERQRRRPRARRPRRGRRRRVGEPPPRQGAGPATPASCPMNRPSRAADEPGLPRHDDERKPNDNADIVSTPTSQAAATTVAYKLFDDMPKPDRKLDREPNFDDRTPQPSISLSSRTLTFQQAYGEPSPNPLCSHPCSACRRKPPLAPKPLCPAFVPCRSSAGTPPSSFAPTTIALCLAHELFDGMPKRPVHLNPASADVLLHPAYQRKHTDTSSHGHGHAVLHVPLLNPKPSCHLVAYPAAPSVLSLMLAELRVGTNVSQPWPYHEPAHAHALASVCSNPWLSTTLLAMQMCFCTPAS